MRVIRYRGLIIITSDPDFEIRFSVIYMELNRFSICFSGGADWGSGSRIESCRFRILTPLICRLLDADFRLRGGIV